MNKCRYDNIGAICGNYVSLEGGLILKNFFQSMGCLNILLEEKSVELMDFDFSYNYKLNKTLVLLESLVNIIFFGLTYV